MSDLIERQAVLEIAEMSDFFESSDAFNDFLIALYDLPVIQIRQRWIPVSEALPKELVPVNITWINRNPAPYYQHYKDKPFTGTAIYHRGKWWWYSSTCEDYLAEYGKSMGDEMDEAIEVIAWQPLPDPYKGVEE